jgi:hypothetical protein
VCLFIQWLVLHQEEEKGEVSAALNGQFLRQAANLTGRFTPGGNKNHRREPPLAE